MGGHDEGSAIISSRPRLDWDFEIRGLFENYRHIAAVAEKVKK